MKNEYLSWLSKKTPTKWWHDSADPDELKISLENGTVGVTTNPPLVKQAIYNRPEIWKESFENMPSGLDPAQKAEEIIRRVTVKIASMMEPIYFQTKGEQGYVCAQVNPRFPGDVDAMLPMARRLSKWAPNIAVKLPVTAAGLDVLEECAAEGITVTATVSFTVPQVLAIAERYQKGIERARKAGVKPGKCFAVIMIGRIDDYLRDVAHDRKAAVEESDIIQAGIAISKRAYSIYKEKGYEATIMLAGMRGTYHATEFAGADMALSIHPKIQALIAKIEGPFGERINESVDNAVIERLKSIPEFVRAYEPDGMEPVDFITYGVVQKTLSQFVEAGWGEIEIYKI
ncbi:MAG TPA: transaldolase family protein [Anaerovoracaceae bacterium]|nr:transaldolase family protein [Anaerovoracaceae bacterium]